MSVFRPASLNGIATGKNVANYKASKEMEMGTVVELNDTTKVFEPSADGKYAIWQYADIDAHVLGKGTNYTTVKEDDFARLFYLPSLIGLKDGFEVGGDVIAETGDIVLGTELTVDANGQYIKATTGTYPIAFVVTDIIDEYDFTRYICEVVQDLEVQ